MIVAWLAVAAAAPAERDAHTVELGAGSLPACASSAVVPEGLASCAVDTSVRGHGDHRLPRHLMVAWDVAGSRRAWTAEADGRPAYAAWRVAGGLSVGWQDVAAWGDIRVYVGPSVEWVGLERSRLGQDGLAAAADVPWLDPGDAPGSVPGWLDVGVLIGNDLDWPLGPVRLGFRWQYRLSGDVVALGDATGPAPDTLSGLDVWELHATSLAVPWRGPVGAYVELGWTNQFTVPLREPGFRVAPWLAVGVQIRAGKIQGRPT